MFLDGRIRYFIADINILWLSALAIGIVIIVGFLMASKHKKREPVPVSYKVIHIAGTIVGASLALFAALMGDTHIWVNVILAIIIVILGIMMGLGKVTKSSAKKVLYTHASVAIVCYTLFLYYIIAL